MASLQRMWLRLFALFLGLCIGIAMCEIGLRICGMGPEQARTQFRFDARYGEVPADSWIFNFQIDPKRHRAVDLRGQLVPLDKPSNELRVLFIGDSVTEGAFVPRERAFPARFEALANERGLSRHVVAINAGVWGMTTIDELHLLRDKLLPLKPDVVVLGLFMPNDINMNLGHRRKRLRYNAPRWVDLLRTHSALAQTLFLQALALNQRTRFMTPHSLGARWVDERLTLLDEHGLHMLNYPAGELSLYVRGHSALREEAYAILRDALSQLQELGAAHSFALRVLVIPSPSTVIGHLAILAHPGILVELRRQGVAIDSRLLDFAQPVQRVLSLCQELQLDCVNATPQLRKLGLRAFFAHDEHPTIAGHAALARALVGDH